MWTGDEQSCVISGHELPAERWTRHALLPQLKWMSERMRQPDLPTEPELMPSLCAALCAGLHPSQAEASSR
jgi:hypothetical protein